MKGLLRTVLLAAACVCIFAAPAQAAYKQEYKLSVVPNATSGWGLTGTYFADQVREKTNGRINIKVYHGAQLMAGKQNSELLLVRRGAIDFALASTINWSPQVKELNLTALPFFIA
ncbi:MAG: TRAP transporter substrate-binding protein DctP, partial [Desulfovibrionaceae bacterium]|nr:TRAP transporter substrate-binding protein DctP [Desulfovibrionaceae bacterium]